jgi:uncharacterized phage protein (TIGR02216 family)
MSSGFDWPGLLRAGVRVLGLKPKEFWALTPTELWLMLGPEAGEMPMGRSRLDELSRIYPDKGADDG